MVNCLHCGREETIVKVRDHELDSLSQIYSNGKASIWKSQCSIKSSLPKTMKYSCLSHKLEMILQKVSSSKRMQFVRTTIFFHIQKNQKAASICVIGLPGVSTFALICCFITP